MMKRSTRKRQKGLPPPPPPIEEEEEKGIIKSPSLPDEMIVRILSLLPSKSILTSRCVCKHWCNRLIKDPNLVKSHLNRSIANHNLNLLISYHSLPMKTNDYERNSGCIISTINLSCSSPQIEGDVKRIDDPFNSLKHDVNFYSSCNGLVLMNNPWSEKNDDDDIMLWNPSTAEIRKIPNPVNEDRIAPNSGTDDDKSWSYLYGLEYSHIIRDYKIVRVGAFSNIYNGVCYICEIKVYTLGTSSWKTVPFEFTYNSHLGISAYQKQVSANGILHWIRAPRGNATQGNASVSRVVVSFDVEHDAILDVPLSSGLQESLTHSIRSKLNSSLGNFDGCLSVILGRFFQGQHSEISIWVMKAYGVRESWTKLYTIASHSMISISYFRMDVWGFVHGMILFLKDDRSLVLYDPEHGIARDMGTGGLPAEHYRIGSTETFTESIVSLNSGTYLGHYVSLNK
ncbi:hypothetical protein MKX03_014015 [Papaver bracteatum]|nr:hypothetical protein MKX03_014015 [Papaver bracteatum]